MPAEPAPTRSASARQERRHGYNRGMQKKGILLAAVAVGLGLIAGAGIGWLLGATGVGQAAPLESLDARERAFAERMRNVVLTGHFTIEGRERRDGLPERYAITSATKLDGDRWRFDVHMTYGSVDVTMPVVVPIVWAGDTPMVSITDFEIPGLGDQFGARVVFYDERYAGTWDHGEYGGMMYGTISPAGGD